MQNTPQRSNDFGISSKQSLNRRPRQNRRRKQRKARGTQDGVHPNFQANAGTTAPNASRLPTSSGMRWRRKRLGAEKPGTDGTFTGLPYRHLTGNSLSCHLAISSAMLASACGELMEASISRNVSPRNLLWSRPDNHFQRKVEILFDRFNLMRCRDNSAEQSE